MGEIKKVSIHTANGWESVPVDVPAIKHTNDAASGYNPEWWKPITSSDVFGGIRNIDKNRSYAYACGNARGKNIAKANIYLYKKTGKGLKEIYEHPFLDLISHPNSYKQSLKLLIWLSMANMDFKKGNAYWYVPNGLFDVPQGFYLLPSKYVQPNFNAEMTDITSYTYFGGRKKVEYSKEEILHFKLPNPDSNLVGMGTADRLNFTTDIDFYIAQYMKNFFENDTLNGTVYSAKEQLRDDVYQRSIDTILEHHKGIDKSGNPLFLEGDVTVQESRGPKELDFAKSRMMTRDEICSIFEVPKPIIAITDDVNYANARAALQTFLENTISPLAEVVFESMLDLFVKERYDSKLVVKFDYTLKTDRETQLNEYTTYAETGMLSLNELRERDGFEKDNDPRSDTPMFYLKNKSAGTPDENNNQSNNKNEKSQDSKTNK